MIYSVIEKGRCMVQRPFPLSFTLHGGNGGGTWTQPKCKIKSTIETPLKVIHGAGGHFVLCRDKKPIHTGCYRNRPSVDECLSHDGTLALIPYSIGSSALDVDQGDWRRLPDSWVNYPTRRKGGRHLFYSDDQARGNSAWAAEDCSGEVRGARGHIIPWGDGLSRLADALTGPRQRELFPFPFDLIQKAKLLQFPHKAVFVPGQSLQLEQVLKGARHTSLFECSQAMGL